jgi:uncharacterized protein
MASGRLVVGVIDIRRQLGTRKPVHRRARYDDLAVSSASVDPDGDVEVDLELESISNGVVAEGTLTFPWVGECRRCLGEVRATGVAEVREVFERRPVEGETYPMGNDLVDLGPMVRDAVLLALPLAPLCTEVCEGPVPESFPAAVEADEEEEPAGAGDDERPRDPRWAALDQLGFDRD